MVRFNKFLAGFTGIFRPTANQGLRFLGLLQKQRHIIQLLRIHFRYIQGKRRCTVAVTGGFLFFRQVVSARQHRNAFFRSRGAAGRVNDLALIISCHLSFVVNRHVIS